MIKSTVGYEKSLLGIFITQPNEFEKVRGAILPKDFQDEKNAIVFQSLLNISAKGFEVEVVPLIEDIKQNGNIDKIGGSEYIDLLISEAGLTSNVRKYAAEITEASVKKEITTQLQGITKDPKYIDLTSDDILQRVESKIITSARINNDVSFKSADIVVQEVMADIDKILAGEAPKGIRTGFAELDKVTGGFKGGQLLIIAARPSMGKTALALNIAANVSKEKSVAFFSLEMGYKELMKRVLGSTGFITSQKLDDPTKMTQTDRQKFTVAEEKARKLKLFLNDSSGITLGEIVWLSKMLKKNNGLDMIIIDYLQLIETASAGETRQNVVAIISRTLKKLARELDVPVIALSQLSRKVENRDSKIPMMSDLRESGAIEQDADLVAFVHRDAYYPSADGNGDDKNSEHPAKIIIGKNRNGPTGVTTLSFVPKYGLFMNMSLKPGDENE